MRSALQRLQNRLHRSLRREFKARAARQGKDAYWRSSKPLHYTGYVLDELMTPVWALVFGN